jgi:hypothetical protein
MALVAGMSSVLLAQEQPKSREPGWVGLFSTDMLGWLENENRLSALCGEPSVDRIEEWTKCQAEKTSPAIFALPVMREPDPGAERLGTIIVSAVPGSGLTAHYLPVGESRAQAFTPDLCDRDWGYGPYFHVLEVVDGSVRVRPEQPADMWCDEGDPPPLEPFKETILTPADLYDQKGHLTIRPKYLRGC